MAERDPAWVPTQEAIRLAGFVNKATFLKAVRARHIVPVRGRRSQLFYSRAKMLELARDREAAEKRRTMGRNGKLDPLNAPATTGEIHAQAFELFEKRTSLHDVVKSLKLPAEIVADLFEKWWKLGQVTEQWLRPQPTSSSAPMPAPSPAEPPEPATPPATESSSPRPADVKSAIDDARAALDTVRRAVGT